MFTLSRQKPRLSSSPKTVPQIRTANIFKQPQILASLLLAFSEDPAARWLYPDAHQYLADFPRFIQTFAGKAFQLGTAFCCDGYAGAALWFPPGVEPDSEPMMALLQQTAIKTRSADVVAVFERMEQYHPSQTHWYLPMIGVEPTQQGKGYGSALMRVVLNQCDREGFPAYLEASKPLNIPFYEQHGFEVLGTIQVGASPTIIPMIRYPR